MGPSGSSSSREAGSQVPMSAASQSVHRRPWLLALPIAWALVAPAHAQSPAFLVRDIHTAASVVGSNPVQLVQAGPATFSMAPTPQTGAERWKTDGTPGGTVLVKDIARGAVSSFPQSLIDRNGTLVFAAADVDAGFELAKSDGTAAGTVRVKDISPG